MCAHCESFIPTPNSLYSIFVSLFLRLCWNSKNSSERNEREKETERETERKTEREREIEKDRDREDRDREREKNWTEREPSFNGKLGGCSAA
jgi:hypothetical protein